MSLGLHRVFSEAAGSDLAFADHDERHPLVHRVSHTAVLAIRQRYFRTYCHRTFIGGDSWASPLSAGLLPGGLCHECWPRLFHAEPETLEAA